MSGTLGTVPVGTICAIVSSSSYPPSGWLWCNGGTFDGNQFPELAALLTNNTLPDLRDRTLVGAGGTYNPYQTLGAASVTLTKNQMPSHQHYGWGEHQDSSGWGLGYGKSVNNGYTGSNKTDTDNNLFGSTWEGGNAGGDIDVTYIDAAGHQQPAKTSSKPSPNDPISVMQPSYTINYFIYAGKEA